MSHDRRDDEPEYPWDSAERGWKEWYSAHRDARAEMLCTAREDVTQLVEIRQDRVAFLPALRELARLGLIQFFVLDHWPPVTENMRSLPISDALIVLEDPARWDPADANPRIIFATTEKGDRAARAEAFHFNKGRFVEWRE